MRIYILLASYRAATTAVVVTVMNAFLATLDATGLDETVYACKLPTPTLSNLLALPATVRRPVPPRVSSPGSKPAGRQAESGPASS